MAKRFTDTEKWKKPFIRGLEGPYKLLWFYILDDCDHAGIWQVDFEVARIRIGEQVDKETAKKLFGDRVVEFAPFKWFLPDFIFFQYGELSEKNRMHKSVIDILTKNNLGASKPLLRGQGTIQGQGNGQGERQEQGGDEILEDYKNWTEQIIEGRDQYFEQMFMKETIPSGPHIQYWIQDHLGLLNRYPKMRPRSQQAFRESCIKHIRENFKKPTNGTGKNKRQANTDSLKEALANDIRAEFGGG